MALKFLAKRGVLAASPKPVTVRQDLAVDDFQEVPARKKVAVQRATAYGHTLRPWHKRQNDPYGRWNAYCLTCNALVVVCTETPEGFPGPIYGQAATESCNRVQKKNA